MLSVSLPHPRLQGARACTAVKAATSAWCCGGARHPKAPGSACPRPGTGADTSGVQGKASCCTCYTGKPARILLACVCVPGLLCQLQETSCASTWVCGGCALHTAHITCELHLAAQALHAQAQHARPPAAKHTVLRAQMLSCSLPRLPLSRATPQHLVDWPSFELCMCGAWWTAGAWAPRQGGI